MPLNEYFLQNQQQFAEMFSNLVRMKGNYQFQFDEK